MGERVVGRVVSRVVGSLFNPCRNQTHSTHSTIILTQWRCPANEAQTKTQTMLAVAATTPIHETPHVLSSILPALFVSSPALPIAFSSSVPMPKTCSHALIVPTLPLSHTQTHTQTHRHIKSSNQSPGPGSGCHSTPDPHPLVNGITTYRAFGRRWDLVSTRCTDASMAAWNSSVRSRLCHTNDTFFKFALWFWRRL